MKKRFLSLALTMVMMLGMGVTSYADSNYDCTNKTEEEIAEKIANSADNNTRSADKVVSQEDKSIEEAYQRVQNEETYIVNLINKMSNSNTTLSNWEYNLKWLKDNYNYLKKSEDKVNFKCVDSYIEAYEIVLLDKNLPDEKQRAETDYKSALKSSSSYSPSDAVDYAETYYKNYNSNYPDWSEYGGDCANFVSQCLYAGGKSMKNGSATDFSKWFSSGNSTNRDNVSSTWRGADAFKHYWKVNASKYKKFTSFDGAFDYGWRGDAVSLLSSNGRAVHTLIIVGYDSGDLVYGAHTRNTIDGSLEKVTENKAFIIYNME